MAFPFVLVLTFNVSVFIFLLLIYFMYRNRRNAIIKIKLPAQYFSLMFAIAAIISVLAIPDIENDGSFIRAITVLPNYIYWSMMILFFVSHYRDLNVTTIYRAIFHGLLATLIYYLVLQNYLSGIIFFKHITQNTYAFVLICYAPFAVYYLDKTKSRFLSLALLALMIATLLIDGRRAGTFLVLVGGLSVLYFPKVNMKQFISVSTLLLVLFLGMKLQTVENFIYNANERIYALIYETDKVVEEDRSYLLRIAMVQKGLKIFEEYPLTGIGLNNFTNFGVDLENTFVGAQYVINKTDVNEKSAHNSYISLLAEGGLLLIIPFILILLRIILYFIYHFNTIPRTLHPAFFGVILMCIHFYFISAVVNVFAWFLLALAISFIYKDKLRKNSIKLEALKRSH